MWRDYFSFNKRQRNGIAVLASLTFLLICALIILDFIPPSAGNIDFKQFKSLLATINSSHLTGRGKSDTTAGSGSKNEPKTYAHSEKININTCSVKELSHFPGIGYYLALALVNYRELHGKYKTTQDLQKCRAVDDSTLNKIKNSILFN